MNRAARKRPHRVLLDEDITSMLQDDDDSEDGLDLDDDSLADPDFSPELETFEDNTSTLDIDVDSIIETLESNHESSVPSPPSAETASHGPLPSSAQSNQSNKTATKPTKLNLRWKKKSLQVNSEQLRFKGNMNLGTELLELETPIQFFFYLFPQELIKMISEETNLYQVQNDPNSTFRVTEMDIRQFMGVVYLMSLIRLPRVTNHWNPILGTPIIQDTMPLNKFEKVRQTLHFNDNSKNLPRNDPGYDRIFKIRPVVESLNAAYKKVPLEEHLCVDEQMCSTKARNVLKRYNPQKPHKWGYKIYVLSGVSGYAYKTEIETGKENITLPEEPDLGAASNVVMRLARLIPRHQNYQLYFDNYFTSLRLLEYLAKEGIHSLGTIRRNRIPDCKLQPEKILLKKPRGHSEEYVADVNGTDISNVAWKDNKIVTLVSTFAGIQPETDVRRWDKQNSRYVSIKRPNVVGEYNRHMGGVDLIDSIMAIYKIQLRSKRWQIRLFYHYLDLTMANAWLLYKRVCKDNGLSCRLSSADFRLDVAVTLCKLGTKPSMSSRRSLENEIQAKKHKGPAQHAPPMAVRQDQIGHWPQWSDKKIRCKFPKCTGFTHNTCEKCGVALCYTKTKNCFRNFHLS
ncbi:piggyBac transposable element-derived protein 2-like [Colias croceus]|uniref:piggyBac transposable element-derived protein 2-like n=1 Tax=Colias crocea TaxID=72248 RepID=UPI001E27B786|nr:piggyBac transposable element-derived protein 2-like [Colias croceus]